jgi:hypothetical protein
MIIAGIIGSLAGGGAPSKTVTWGGIYYSPIQEGQEQHVDLNYSNWDSSTIYWTIKNNLGAELTSQVTPVSGSFNPGSGSGSHAIYFTFNADATTDGPLTYYVWVGSGAGQQDYLTSDPYIVRDSSQLPALILDVDPASLTGPLLGLNGWIDASGNFNNLSISSGTKSANNGGTLVFNGTSTYAGDLMNANLNSSVYGTVSLSAWIKPTAVTGSTQAIIAKELCYKIIIANDGRIAWMTAKGYEPWEITAYVDAGILTAGAWAQVVATVNADYTRIYVNGVKITETTGNVIGANNSTFNIGCYDSSNDFFAGSMGEIKMWNYAINEATVLAQYNATASRYGRSPIPLSLDFPGTGNPYLLVSDTQSDWNLGTTYTIEFWSKGGNASNSAIRTVMTQTDGSGNIDLGYAYANLMFNGTQPNYTEPSPGVWTHVAFVRASGSGNITLYYNGVYATSFSAGPALANDGSDLYIGKRGSSVNGQGFYGKLAMLRISNTAKYTENFDPSNSYGSQDGTVLLLSSANPLSDLSGYELDGVVPSTQNGDNLYFSKSTYPDLNTQIRAGNTVVDANNPTNISTIVAVTSADINNWGVHVSPSLPFVTSVNFSGPGRHSISVQGAVGISTDFPNFQSLVFNNPEGDYLSTPASADWNLGNNWTIEFWIKSNNNSANNINIPGGQWGLINQGGWYGGMPDDNCILIGLTAGALTINQSRDGDISFVEPTTRVWTHVAIVNNGGGSAQKVYYNGVEQTPLGANYTSNGKTNTTEALYIGRLKPSSGGLFDGKMAMVRISNTAKYLVPFTATTTYGVEADTKLFLGKLNPVVDNKSHTMTINGVTTSTDFPS